MNGSDGSDDPPEESTIEVSVDPYPVETVIRFLLMILAVYLEQPEVDILHFARLRIHCRIDVAPLNWVAGYSVAAIVGASFFATDYFREDVVRDEFRMRIEPSLTAVRAADHDPIRKTYILTLEPLIPQMYAGPSVDVVSLSLLDDAVMKDIGFDQGAVGVLYLDEQIHRSLADEERYKSLLEYLNQFRRTSLMNNSLFSIVKIDNVSADNGASQDDGSQGRE